MASPLDDLSPQQLKTLLEDTQGSLAASLARIEAFRLRERLLTHELAQLRQQVHGQASSKPGSRRHSASGGGGELPQQQELASQSTCSITIPPAPPSFPFTGLKSSSPLYVTSLEGGEHAVAIVQGGKRVGVGVDCMTGWLFLCMAFLLCIHTLPRSIR